MQFTLTRRAAALALLASAAMPAAFAEEAAAGRISAFYAGLLGVMKDAKALGFRGRITKLSPLIEGTFDIPAMTRLAVGPDWTSLSPGDQTALTGAFRRMTAATYAHNFDGFSGERFTVDDKVQTRGADTIVESQIVPTSDAPVKLTYRMRKSGPTWKAIDVYYNGSVSELTTRRAEFGAILKSQGAKGLLAHIDALTDKLSK